jgi:Tfp pilus assembly protein PilF
MISNLMKQIPRLAILCCFFACYSFLGCSSLKSFGPKKHRDSKQTSSSALLGSQDDESEPADPVQQRIGLLQARASLAEMDDQVGDAIRAYQSILELDPNHLTSHHRLALLFVQQEQVEQAETHFLKAIQLADASAVLHNDYGYFCHLRGHAEKAEEQLRRALQLDPELLAAHNNLGLVLAGENRISEAETHFRLARCDRAQTLNNLALARFLSSDIEEASAMYRKALQVDPTQQQAQQSLQSLQRLAESTTEVPAAEAVMQTSLSEDMLSE